MSFEVSEFRKFFPQLERKMGPNRLIYFDNGASTLKHSEVTDRLNTYNRFETSNVHRGAHHTSRQGTESYEDARSRVADFLKAQSSTEIVFTRGTTESINLVSFCLSIQIKRGDEILISPLEHHSNIVPWQVLCEKTGAELKVVPLDLEGGVTEEAILNSINDKTRVVALIHYSNSFGNRIPLESALKVCREKGIYSLIDCAQTILTEKVDVSQWDCDFLCFSGHKLFGPYGIGALYVNQRNFGWMPPYQTGGSMIDRVSFEKTSYAEPPQKFEAGTPNISGAIGLGMAIDVIQKMDFKAQHTHVIELRKKLVDNLASREKVNIIDFPSEGYSGVVSFNIKGSHPSDVGALLDKYGIAVRAGHHCTQPAMELLGIPGTVRVSLAAYNTHEEIDYFHEILNKVEEFF